MIPMVWRALELTDWMWGDHDKLEVIIIPRHLKELTCLSWEPFKKRGEREVRKEGDLWETIMYLIFFGVDGKMTRGNPQWNKIDVGLNSGHWS